MPGRLRLPPLLILGLVVLGQRAVSAQDRNIPTFAANVFPILQAYCAGCHNPGDHEGKLDLTTYESLRMGGENGAVLIPGNSEESRIIQVLTGKAEPSMPPEGNEPPAPEEIEILRDWIDRGALGPGTGEMAADAGKEVNIPRIEPVGDARRDIGAIAFSPRGKLLAISRYGEVELVDVATRATVRILAGHDGKVNSVAFSSTGTQLAAAAGQPGLRGEVRIWDVETGSEIRVLIGHRDAIYAVAFSADDKLLATGSYDQEIKLWSVDTGELLSTLSGHSGPVFALAFRPRGRGMLASASGDRTVKLWDVYTGERLETFGQPLKELYALAWTPEGTRVAAGGVDNRIRIWAVSETAKEGTNPLLTARFAHEGAIVSVVYAPDGASLVSAAEDRTVRVWDTEPMRERYTLKEQSDWPVALAISADSRLLAIGRLDGTYSIHRLENGQLVPPQPRLASLSAHGLQRGVASTLELQGRNFEFADAVRFSDERIEVRILETNAGRLRVEITPPAEVPRGRYDLWVESGTQASSRLPVYVDDIPQLSEAEPNDSVAGATRVELPAACWGTLASPGDRDHYVFSARGGETLVFDAAAESLGSKANLVLTLRTADGKVLASCNDFQGQADPLLGFTVPDDGDYVVQVEDLQAAASPEHYYRLSAGKFAFVTGHAPIGVAEGSSAAIRWTGWNVPPGASTILEPSEPGLRTVAPPESLRVRGLPRVQVTGGARITEQEPNDGPADATLLAAPIIADGVIQHPGDVDCYRFSATAGETWIVEIVAAEIGSPIDSLVEVLDGNGRRLPRLLLQAIRDSYTTFRPSTSDQTGFRVTNWEEMHLDQYLYLDGDVAKIFRQPRGPDSDTLFYSLEGRRRGYFDTTPTAHALDRLIYVVEPHPVGTALEENGLPVFPVYFENDDDSYRKKGRDSRLTFTAPQDGAYVVRVRDVRGFGGEGFAYQLVLRRPKPDFKVTLEPSALAVPRGSGRRFTVNAERIDECDEDIRVDIEGIPDGFYVSSPLVIQSGHQNAHGVVYCHEGADPSPDAWSQVRVTATATVEGEERARTVRPFTSVSVADTPRVRVFLSPDELTITPGQTITAQLRVERDGYEDRIVFEVENLPHGVIVDNIGLNGVLIPPGETERTIFITAEHWLGELSRSFQATAEVDGGQTSLPVTLHVRRLRPLARARE